MFEYSGMIAIYIFIWFAYFFWIGLYGAVIFAGILGWKKTGNSGYILILISGCVRLLHHLPSIYYKGFFASRRLPVEEFGKLAMTWGYIDNVVIPIASLLLVIGLLFVVLKKNGAKADSVQNHTGV